LVGFAFGLDWDGDGNGNGNGKGEWGAALDRRCYVCLCLRLHAYVCMQAGRHVDMHCSVRIVIVEWLLRE